MSFHAVSALSQDADSERAARAVGERIRVGFRDQPLAALLVYATVNHDQGRVLEGLRATVGPGVTIAGCSAQGVMANGAVGEGGYVLGAMGLGGPGLRVASARADTVHLEARAKGAALRERLAEQLAGDPKLTLIMYDPLFGVDVSQLLAGMCSDNPSTIVGAAAGQPSGPLARTYQYEGDEAFSQGALVLGLDGDFTFDLGVSPGTTPTGVVMTLTRADGNKLLELDGRRALDVWREVIGCTEDEILNQDQTAALAMGIERRFVEDGREQAGYLMRAIFGFDRETGAIVAQAAIPEGSKIMFHHRTVRVVRDGAEAMGRELAARIADRRPWAVLGFECGARTNPFLGAAQTLEENLALQEVVAPRAPWLGLIGWGEIVPCGGVPEFNNFTYPLVVLGA